MIKESVNFKKEGQEKKDESWDEKRNEKNFSKKSALSFRKNLKKEKQFPKLQMILKIRKKIFLV